MTKTNSKPAIVFFGTPTFAVGVLEALREAGIKPDLVVTNPDRPQGRGQKLTPPPVKEWALLHHIDFIQPADLKDRTSLSALFEKKWDVGIVAAYGKILPQEIIDLPEKKTLNVHPSLLPKLRGAAPIQETILRGEEVGVTIIRLDEKMDHGPIIAQEKVSIKNIPDVVTLEHALAIAGGALLARVLPDWLLGNVSETPQDESEATYTKKVLKDDALINLSGDPETEYRKIQAYKEWPKPFFFVEKDGRKIRVIITAAELVGGHLTIKKVIPEGESERDYNGFIKTLD